MENKPMQSQCKYIALILPLIILMFVGFKLMISHKMSVSAHRRSSYAAKNDTRLAQLDTLVLAQVLFRHGSRTPLTDYKNNAHKDYMKIYGVKGLGQLTPIGMDQCCKLGLYLRNRYDGFISTQYSFDQIYMQSSDVDRTIMSALSLLQGLYPNPAEAHNNDCKSNPGDENCPKNTWRPIPVHVLSKSVDNKICFLKKCDKYERLFQEYLKSPEMTKLDEENQDFYKFLQEVSGGNVTSFLDVYHIQDTLLINKLYGLSLPDWTNDIFPEKMAKIGNIEFTSFTPTDEMKRLFIGPFLEELITNMDVKLRTNCSDAAMPMAVDEDYRRAKLYLYSGHDTTISSFLNVLGVFDGHPPPYTAAVILEMHRIGESVFIKVFYRPDQTNKTTEIILPKCGQPCTLEKFKEIYAQYWKSWSNGGWDAECRDEKKSNY